MINDLCLQCKGSRHLCGNKFCPLLKEKVILKSLSIKNLMEFQGSSPPSIFVGRYNYPNISISPLVSNKLGDLEDLENYAKLVKMDYSKIITGRLSLLRANIGKFNVKKPGKLHYLIEDFALAKKGIDTEVINKKVILKPEFSNFFQAMGPLLRTEKIIVTSNPTSNKKIEKVVNDELKATEGIRMLYSKKVGISKIIKVFSVGMLGKSKKLVPTRWSITAVDDITSKHLIERIKNYSLINEYLVFEHYHLGNHYVILFFPERFCFEQMEAWFEGSLWSKKTRIVSDYEFFNGRKNYAKNITGGYYSGRLAVSEFLSKIKRQAGVIVFREIDNTYIYPLGVWQVRQNIRDATKKTPMKFEELNNALKYIKSKLNIDWDSWKEKSRILNFLTAQEKITKWF